MKDESKTKGKKKSKANSSRPPAMPMEGSDERVDPGAKYTRGKRKYRTLDSMVLASATSLYLVFCLVVRAAFFRTAALSVVYGIFVYQFTGQFL